MWVWSLGWKDPLEGDAWQPTPVFLPRESHGQRSLVGCSPQDRSVRHDWSDLAQHSIEVGGQNLPSSALWKYQRFWESRLVFLLLLFVRLCAAVGFSGSPRPSDTLWSPALSGHVEALLWASCSCIPPPDKLHGPETAQALHAQHMTHQPSKPAWNLVFLTAPITYSHQSPWASSLDPPLHTHVSVDFTICLSLAFIPF